VRDFINEEASEPKAPKVSSMKGTKVEAREAVREAYLEILDVACRLATARGVGGMER